MANINSNDDIRSFYQAAFKPSSLVDSGSIDPKQSVPVPTSIQPTEAVFTPSVDPTAVVPLIFELKTKLAKLEEQLYSKNGPQMKQHLEMTFARLTTTDLDHVIEALGTLNGILDPSKNEIYSYERYLKGSVDRIVLLCAKQYRLFFTTYWKDEDSEDPELLKKLQNLLDLTTELLISLILQCPIKTLGTSVSREALHELMQSILPYIGWYYRSKYLRTQSKIDSPYEPIQFDKVHNLVGAILGSRFYSCTGQALARDSSVPMVLKAVLLRLFRDFTEDSLSSDSAHSQQQLNMFIDVLTMLIRSYLCGYSKRCDPQDLKPIVYEIYCLFEVYSKMGNSFLFNDSMQALDSLKSFICSIFTALGTEDAWKQFSLVDKELALTMRDPQEVPLFKYLAGRGFTRSVETKNPVKKVKKQPVTEPLEQEVQKPMLPGVWKQLVSEVAKPVIPKLIPEVPVSYISMKIPQEMYPLTEVAQSKAPKKPKNPLSTKNMNMEAIKVSVDEKGQAVITTRYIHKRNADKKKTIIRKGLVLDEWTQVADTTKELEDAPIEPVLKSKVQESKVSKSKVQEEPVNLPQHMIATDMKDLNRKIFQVLKNAARKANPESAAVKVQEPKEPVPEEPKDSVPVDAPSTDGSSFVEVDSKPSTPNSESSTISPLPTIQVDSDSDIVILDLEAEDKKKDSGNPVQELAKISEPLEDWIVQPTATEEESEKSFEVLQTPESEAPEVVKMVLVSAPESQNPEPEQPTVAAAEGPTAPTAPTGASESKETNKKELLTQVQQMHSDLLKSQEMISKLLAKLANQKIN